MSNPESLFFNHGGYKKLKTFQIAQLIYDLTVEFCDRFVSARSRTRDQMVQAARSGVQNIAEGSVASGTSKKIEMKLTNIARASLEELRLDYQDFLRQRTLELLAPNHPALVRFKAKRCARLEDVQTWVNDEMRRQTRTNTDQHRPTRTRTEKPPPVRDRPCSSVPVRGSGSRNLTAAALWANAALSLLNLCCYLLDRQLAAQAEAFEDAGGFAERLCQRRSAKRQRPASDR